MPARWEHTFQRGDSFTERSRRRRHDPGPGSRSTPHPELDAPGKPCGCGPWCMDATVHRDSDGNITRIPASSHQAVCPACASALGKALRLLSLCWPALEQELAEPVRRMSVIRTPFGATIPLREDVDELMRDLLAVLCAWHARIAAVKHLMPPDPRQARTSPGAAVAEAAAVISRWPSALIALEAEPMERGRPGQREPEALGGADAVTAILRLRRRAELVLGLVEPHPEPLIGVRCYRCDHKALVRADPPSTPDGVVYYSRCRRCDHRMTEPEYRQHVKRLLAIAQGRETARLA